MAIFILLLTGIVLAYFWIKNKSNYWKDRGVATLSNGNLKNTRQLFLRENAFADRSLQYYRTFKSQGAKHGGIMLFLRPLYIPIDVDIIKSIMQVDFQHFVDRGFYVNEKGDPLTAHLFSLGGKKWKLLRTKLTPTFTSGKMKMMYETVLDCTRGLLKVMDKEIENTIDIKDTLGRFTTDVIGSCAFGLDCNSLENPDSEFRQKGKAFFERTFMENIKILLIFSFPDLMLKLNVRFIPKHVSDFFMGIVKETVAYREANDVSRKDFLQLLIQLKNRGKLVDDEKLDNTNITDEENKFSIEVLAAQVLVFFEAGFETSSTTMTFCLYELSKNKTVQSKVRDEIRRVLAKHGGKFTYEAMIDMHYLEQTINETLRKYPPLGGLNRTCTIDYKIPGTDIVIEKGTRVMIPVMGIHHDPEYYPDPEKFDPDRFTEENKQSRPNFTFLPFGDGPRICIGLRFGMMQAKVGLVALLLNYEFEVNKKTKEPLVFDTTSFITSTEGGVWLDYKKIVPETKYLT